MNTSPRKIEAIKNRICDNVLFVASGYNSKYNSVPNIYLAEGLRKCLDSDYSCSSKERLEMLHIADVIEAVRRRVRKKSSNELKK